MLVIKSLFEKFFNKEKIKFEIKETEFEIVFSYIECSKNINHLNGIWKFVRVSPFSKNNKVHTSLCNVEIGEIKPEYVLKLNERDLNWDFFKSSGPGGQNKNKTLTAVRLTHIPTGLVVISTQQRSQNDNKIQALKQLREKLLVELNLFLLNKKRSKWEGSDVQDLPNVSLYFNHHLCSCEKTQRKSKNLNGFLGGDLEILA